MKINKSYLFSILFIGVFSFIACNTAKQDPSKEAFAKEYLKLVCVPDLYNCQKMSGEELSGESGKSLLSAYYNFMNKQKADSFQLISVKDSLVIRKKGISIRVDNMVFEAKSNDGFVVYRICVSTYDNGYFAESIQISAANKSLKNTASFNLKAKPTIVYIFITFMFLVLIFIIITAVSIFRTDLDHSWMWQLGNLLGFCSLSLNSTTGEIGFDLLYVQFASLGFHKEYPFGAYILLVSLPLFSILFWLKKRKMSIDAAMLD